MTVLIIQIPLKMLGSRYLIIIVISKHFCKQSGSDPTQLVLESKVINMYICRTENMASRAITHESEEPERTSWHHQGPGWSRRVIIRQVAEAVMGEEVQMVEDHVEGKKEPSKNPASKKPASRKQTESPEKEPENQKKVPEEPEKEPEKPDDVNEEDEIMIIDIIEEEKGEPGKKKDNNRVVTWNGPPTRRESRMAKGESKSATVMDEGKNVGGETRHGGGRPFFGCFFDNIFGHFFYLYHFEFFFIVTHPF